MSDPPECKTEGGIATLPSVSGTYILVLHLAEPRVVTIGRFGVFEFAAGRHLYVGSAHGPGGLRGRLRHHLAPVARLHWHVDYLRAVAPLDEVWYTLSAERLECKWAAALASLPGARSGPPHFGASDCGCAGHLVQFRQKPSMDELVVRLDGERHVYSLNALSHL